MVGRSAPFGCILLQIWSAPFCRNWHPFRFWDPSRRRRTRRTWVNMIALPCVREGMLLSVCTHVRVRACVRVCVRVCIYLWLLFCVFSLGEALDPSKKGQEKWTDLGLDMFTDTWALVLCSVRQVHLVPNALDTASCTCGILMALLVSSSFLIFLLRSTVYPLLFSYP